MPYRLTRLRRYPVKSMGGEDLTNVQVNARGIEGDRWYAVRDGDGHFASGKNTRRFRRRDQVFDYRASTRDGNVSVACDGQVWVVGDPSLDKHLADSMGLPVSVLPEGDIPHQDMGAISLVGSATLAWCSKRWGIDTDPRRLRTNLLVETDEPFVEESWVGHDITIGPVVLRIAQPIPRCRMIDIDQDGATATGRWLKPLAAERDTRIAVYADVVRPGHLTVGSEVTLEGEHPRSGALGHDGASATGITPEDVEDAS